MKARYSDRFPGGLVLQANKDAPFSRPLRRAPLPKRLVVPLTQHAGEAAEPVVKPGQTVRRGEPLAMPAGSISATINAPTSGRIASIEDLPVPHPSGLSAPCVVLIPDGIDTRWDGLQPMSPDNATPEQIQKRLREAGIVGLGGAVFPTDIKLGSREIETVILNGAECEPYICCDAALMHEHPDQVLAGGQLMLRAIGAKRCIIAIEDDVPECRQSFEKALDTLGDDRIELVVVPAIYPSGGERQLIQALTGLEVPADGLPRDIGFACINVATATYAYRAVAMGEALTERIVTVTGGAIAEPANLISRIGTSIADLIAACGGFDGHVERLIFGGPMMGYALPGPDVPVTKATNCILAATADEVATDFNALPCIRCGDCARVCPAGLLPQQLYWHARVDDFAGVERFNLFDCIECGCCAYACPSHIPLVQYYRYAKTEIRSLERAKQAADEARQRHTARESRLQAQKEARQRRLAEKRAALKQVPDAAHVKSEKEPGDR